MTDLKSLVIPWIRPGEQRRRVLMTVFGVLLCGVGVGVCKEAELGVDSFQSLCHGIYHAFPGNEGTTYVLINAVLLAAVLIYNRRYIGLGTLINMFLLGYVADGTHQLLQKLVPDAKALAPLGFVDVSVGQLCFLVIALVILCFSCALYITANLGVSTYDAIALQLEKMGLGKYRVLRICTDAICVAVGWVLGAVPGVCTIITTFMLGPLTSFFMDEVGKPLRYGKKQSA